MVYKIDNNKVKILTKDGECTFHITLDVNLNFTGGIGNFTNQNSPQNTIINSASNKVEEKEEKTMWEIPDFKSTKTSNINFGK
jgi:hypothetical protein